MTNQEWLQQNNAKIEEIKQLLEDKMLVAGSGSYDKNLKIFNINEFEFDGNACTNFKGNKYLGDFIDGCIIPYSYAIKDGEIVDGFDYKVTEIKNGSQNADGSFAMSKFRNYSRIMLPSNITSIGGGCFNDSNIERVLIEADKIKVDGNRPFRNCGALKELDTSKFDTSESTSFRVMFQNCHYLKKLDVSSFDTSNVVDMAFMFNGCFRDEIDVSNFNTSKVMDMSYMFQQMNITTLDLSNFNTSKVTNMSGMFCLCKRLTTLNIGSFDMRKGINTTEMFRECIALTNLTIKNIRNSMAFNDSPLSTDSAINVFKELWDLTGETTLTLTLSTTSKNNIANVYVKLIPVTDEMRAEDEYIDNKKPCVVCESTDEGAMTLTEYGISKNWTIV